jgi:hypothetical protein
MIRISKELETISYKVEYRGMTFHVMLNRIGNINNWSNIRCDDKRWKEIDAKYRVIIRQEIIAELNKSEL